MPAQQAWPELANTPIAAPGTARARSASANTMSGDLPPNSSVTRLRLPAAARTISWPTAVDPVNATLSTPGWAVRAAPVSPNPVTTLRTPGGSPTSVAISPIRRAARLASSAGLSTIVQPDASAGASFHSTLLIGLFHGMIDATTPTGSRSVYVNTGNGIELGSVSPDRRVIAPAK